MSDPISVWITPDATCPRMVVERVLETVGTAVRVNLSLLIASGQPLLPYEDREFPGKTVDEILDGLSKPNPLHSSLTSHASVLARPFCPVSSEGMEIVFWDRGAATTPDIALYLSQRITYEREGSRERDRMEWEWMKKLESHGLVSLEHGWSFEPPTDNEMPSKEYDRWWKRYHDLDETPSIWPQNRQCLLNIIENLKRAVPVKDVRLDPRLLDSLQTS